MGTAAQDAFEAKDKHVVKRIYPFAYCSPLAFGEPTVVIRASRTYPAEILGRGRGRTAAWRDAADRIRAEAKQNRASSREAERNAEPNATQSAATD